MSTMQKRERTEGTFVVTGANSGIGLETARALIGRRAQVVVRDSAKGTQAASQLTGAGSTSVVERDPADLDQVASCAEALLSRHDHLCALISNAGVMGGPLSLSAPGLRAPDGHQSPRPRRPGRRAVAPTGRIRRRACAVVSSGEARGGQLSPRTTREQLLNPAPYDGRQIYRNSKQANLLYVHELHRRCDQTGSPVSAVAVHPGAAATNLLARQLDRSGRRLIGWASTVATTVLLPSAAAGARSTLRALDPSTPGGAFVGPSGLGQLRGRPQLIHVYASGKDPATAARLWQLTEEAPDKTLPPCWPRAPEQRPGRDTEAGSLHPPSSTTRER
jgi:NAD(P)-dependent dehydrogenase (short-subunit alcohol dehydrogenase family)